MTDRDEAPESQDPAELEQPAPCPACGGRWGDCACEPVAEERAA